MMPIFQATILSPGVKMIHFSPDIDFLLSNCLPSHPHCPCRLLKEIPSTDHSVGFGTRAKGNTCAQAPSLPDVYTPYCTDQPISHLLSSLSSPVSRLPTSSHKSPAHPGPSFANVLRIKQVLRMWPSQPEHECPQGTHWYSWAQKYGVNSALGMV